MNNIKKFVKWFFNIIDYKIGKLLVNKYCLNN